MTLDSDHTRAVPATSGLGRRSLLQTGALVLGAGLLGMQGATAANAELLWPGDEGTGAGADGAPPPPGTPQNSMLAAEPSGATSYNGWTVGTRAPSSACRTTPFRVRRWCCSSDRAMLQLCCSTSRNGSMPRSSRLIKGQCGGYSYRANVNNPSVWSNHASATAMDLNWSKHPNGVHGTFTAPQIAAVRQILAFCDGVVYWGEDYRGTVDGMHFEINVPPGSAKLTQLVNKITGVYPRPRRKPGCAGGQGRQHGPVARVGLRPGSAGHRDQRGGVRRRCRSQLVPHRVVPVPT